MILRFASVSLSLVFVCACTSSSGGGGASGDAGPAVPSTGPIPEQLGPVAVAQAICGKVAQCACDWSTSAPCQNDGACSASMCLSTYTMSYQDADMQAVASGEVYDPQGARNCVDAIAAANCEDVDYVNLCTVLWNGTQAIGQSCSASLACETGDAMPAVCGATSTCVAASTGSMGPSMGAPCSGTCSGDTCDIIAGAPGGQCQHTDGLACSAGICQALLAHGQTCSGEFQCADPLACNDGVCSTRLANGSPCAPPTDDDPCEVGSACVAGTCTILKANGQTCASSDICLENNCVAGQCARLGAQPICGDSGGTDAGGAE